MQSLQLAFHWAFPTTYNSQNPFSEVKKKDKQNCSVSGIARILLREYMGV